MNVCEDGTLVEKNSLQSDNTRVVDEALEGEQPRSTSSRMPLMPLAGPNENRLCMIIGNYIRLQVDSKWRMSRHMKRIFICAKYDTAQRTIDHSS